MYLRHDEAVEVDGLEESDQSEVGAEDKQSDRQDPSLMARAKCHGRSEE